MDFIFHVSKNLRGGFVFITNEYKVVSLKIPTLKSLLDKIECNVILPLKNFKFFYVYDLDIHKHVERISTL